MAVVTIEGRIEEGQVRLPDDIRLPNRAKVYLIIPDEEFEVIELPPLPPVVHFRSPRFANREDVARFRVEVVEKRTHAF